MTITVHIPSWVLVVLTVAGYVWVIAGVAVTLETLWHERSIVRDAYPPGLVWVLLLLPLHVLLSIIVLWPWLLHDRIETRRAIRRYREDRDRRRAERSEYPW